VKNVGDRVSIPEEGIVVHAAIRTLMPLMGTDTTGKVHEALKKLREAGYARRIWQSKNGMPDLYLIPESIVSRTSTPEGSTPLLPPSCLYLLCSENELEKDRGEPVEALLGVYEKLLWIFSRSATRGPVSARKRSWSSSRSSPVRSPA
jgi:hypothetical protein